MAEISDNISEFNFDEFDDLDEVNEDDLDEMDKQFINSIQEKSEEFECTTYDDAFIYWLMIVLLIVFIFFIGMAVYAGANWRRRRIAQHDLGYPAY
jgi:hypothetical protein